MIDVDLLRVIRRRHLREGRSIREIVRRTGLSRNTVRQYLASGLVEPRYPHRKSPSQLDPYADTLLGRLQRESKRHRKQRRSVRQLPIDLVELGYPGSYDRVAAFARDWRSRRQEAELSAGKGTFVPLVFAPGEAFRFDRSEDWVVIDGERTRLRPLQALSQSGFYVAGLPPANP